MPRLPLRAVLTVLACSLAVAISNGCALGTSAQSTRVTITVPGDRLLFLAVVPRVLPDGTLADEKREALLKEVSEKSIAPPLIQPQRSAWSPAADRVPDEEDTDVLWVVGRPDVGQIIYETLRDEFGQRVPFVLPIPLQTQTPPSQRRASTAGPPEGAPPGDGP
jgi:hypothetical protein